MRGGPTVPGGLRCPGGTAASSPAGGPCKYGCCGWSGGTDFGGTGYSVTVVFPSARPLAPGVHVKSRAARPNTDFLFPRYRKSRRGSGAARLYFGGSFLFWELGQAEREADRGRIILSAFRI